MFNTTDLFDPTDILYLKMYFEYHYVQFAISMSCAAAINLWYMLDAMLKLHGLTLQVIFLFDGSAQPS